MPKTLILEYDLPRNCGPRADQPIMGTQELAEQNGQYYLRWTPHKGNTIQRTWEPITARHAHKVINAHRLATG